MFLPFCAQVNRLQGMLAPPIPLLPHGLLCGLLAARILNQGFIATALLVAQGNKVLWIPGIILKPQITELNRAAGFQGVEEIGAVALETKRLSIGQE
jgi:hypothetical protein